MREFYSYCDHHSGDCHSSAVLTKHMQRMIQLPLDRSAVSSCPSTDVNERLGLSQYVDLTTQLIGIWG